MPVGTKQGSYTSSANCGGITGGNSLAFSGSNNPIEGITAPAALIGTINSSAGGTLTLTDTALQLTAGNYGSAFLAIFWVSGGVLQCCYNVTISGFSANSGTDSITLTGASATPTGAKYYAASGSAPTQLPANSTPISVAVNQDITDGVSIPGGTGQYIQQLLATSTQPGLIEWLKASGSTQERLSAILAAGNEDTWPTQSNQVGSLPTGSASANNWTTSDTVTVIRCYNIGGTVAQVGVSSQSAVMQTSVILA
jgi:hypothetical protein